MDKVTGDGSATSLINQLSKISHEHVTSAAFSIATPIITTILPISEDMTDPSFMHSTSSYQRDSSIEKPYSLKTQVQSVGHSADGTIVQRTSEVEELGQPVTVEGSNTNLEQGGHSRSITQEIITTESQVDSNNSNQISQNDTAASRKRVKLSKKNAKMDAKSKLEKSRQSARECRARKKLRYQYLEDLVCNREKAVIKLREELTMFCQLSHKIDSGTIDEASKRLLVNQVRENSSESTSYQ